MPSIVSGGRRRGARTAQKEPLARRLFRASGSFGAVDHTRAPLRGGRRAACAPARRAAGDRFL
jgi:hypothetical protein